MNFSQCPKKGAVGAGGQNISFATSTDMIHWTWLEHDWFGIDTEHYNFPGRWDCIATLPVPGAPQPGPVYGFWTGSPKGPAAPWGFGRSEDGLNWKALPPPQLEPPIGGEIGGVEAVSFGSPAQTKYYAMVGHGAMVVYSASEVAGPYKAQVKNYNLLSGTCYFSRFVRGPGGVLLVSHQHETRRGVQARPASRRTPGYGAGRSVNYVGTYKEAVVDDEGTLRLRWWAQNEGLKGDVLPASRGPDGQVSFSKIPDLTRGVIIEGSLDFPSSQAAGGPDAGAGITIGLVEGNISVLVDSQAVSYLVGNTGSSQLKVLDTQNRSLPVQQRTFRILIRENLIETYIGDFLAHVWALGGAASSWPTGQFSVAPTNPKYVGAVQVWQMNLVGSGVGLRAKAGSSSQLPGSFGPELAVDDNPLTRWSSKVPSGNQTEWLSVDLGTITEVAWFRVEWELTFATAYDLEVSDTGADWQRAFRTSEGEGGLEVHRFQVPARGRFFRLVFHERSLPSAGYSVWDWQLHTTADTPGCGYWEVCDDAPVKSEGANLYI